MERSMRKLCVTAGLMVAMAGPALAGPKDNAYDLYVIADEVTDSAIYVVQSAHDTVAIEVFEDDHVQWMKDANAHKAIKNARELFGPEGKSKDKGFAFIIEEDDVKISFPLLFSKHISIHASDEDGAQINITSKDGKGNVLVRAGDDGAFITIVDASAKTAREFIDDIDDASSSMRRKMKKEVGLD
jgi:hypothetical protein